MPKNSYFVIAALVILSFGGQQTKAQKSYTKKFHCPDLHKEDFQYKPLDEFPPGCSKKSIFWTIAEDTLKKKTVYKFKFSSCTFPIKKHVFGEEIGNFQGEPKSTPIFKQWWVDKEPTVTSVKYERTSILTKPLTPACLYEVEFQSKSNKHFSYRYIYQLNFTPNAGLKITKCERDYIKPKFKCTFEEI